MRRAVLLALLPLAACATSGGGAGAAPAFETIAFELNSWGRPLGNWEVHADGTVRHLAIEGSVFGAHRREHRAFTVDRAAFAELAAMAAQLPTPPPSRNDCRDLATDLPYGKVSLSGAAGAQEMSFDTGCLDRPYQAFVGRIRAMDALVAGWAEARPAARFEEVPGN